MCNIYRKKYQGNRSTDIARLNSNGINKLEKVIKINKL